MSKSTRGSYSINSKVVDDFIKASPKFDGPIYRGIKFNTPLKEGDVIGGKQFTSWSSSKGTAEDFSKRRDPKGNNAVIELSQTSAGASIKHLSRNPYENEVLLSRNASLRVKKVDTYEVQDINGRTIKRKRIEVEEFIGSKESKGIGDSSGKGSELQDWITIEEKWERDFKDDVFSIEGK